MSFELVNFDGKPGYYLFSISGSKKDGSGEFDHAVAAQVGLGSPEVLFDANGGEYGLDPQEKMSEVVFKLFTLGHQLNEKYWKIWYSRFA
jgi:hypothetical protein